VEDIAFDGVDEDELQLHLNARADSKCQGVYFNPHMNLWGAVAPGGAMLGYYTKPKVTSLYKGLNVPCAPK